MNDEYQLYAPVRTVDPTAEPVSVGELKAKLAFASDYSEHDVHLSMLIQAAREQWEADVGKVCMSSRWRVQLDDWWCDDGLSLILSPVTSIVSVTYQDTSNATQTWSSSNYTLDTGRITPTVRYTYNVTLPVLYQTENVVSVTYQAGYSSAASVPARWKQAILMLAAHWFEQRTPVAIGTIANDIPLTYERLVHSCMRSTYP